MCQNHDEVEVFEISQAEWDLATQRQLDKVGLTALELKQKHDERRITAQEFKVWMLVSSSTLLD